MSLFSVHMRLNRKTYRCLTFLFLATLIGCSTRSTVVEPTEAFFFRDQVIRKDITWSGVVEIEGVVVVARPATLTIRPGTTVRFKKKDIDSDGTGDSELRVLGRIIAEGRSDAPIVFESAEPDPSPRDWSYLMIYTSGKFNRIDHCRFHHAFSGLQVHFSTASVKNSLFSDNYEGLRFGRADLIIENNRFTSNRVGIRFTRMEGPVLIKNNDIYNNRIGIFLVPSGQNIRDFFEPDRSGSAWNTGHLTITGNNIYDNTTYNLSLGEKQIWNLEITNNFWGNNDPAAIEEMIYDHNRDKSLGRVFYQPFAERKIPTAGINK